MSHREWVQQLAPVLGSCESGAGSADLLKALWHALQVVTQSPTSGNQPALSARAQSCGVLQRMLSEQISTVNAAHQAEQQDDVQLTGSVHMQLPAHSQALFKQLLDQLHLNPSRAVSSKQQIAADAAAAASNFGMSCLAALQQQQPLHGVLQQLTTAASTWMQAAVVHAKDSQAAAAGETGEQPSSSSGGDGSPALAWVDSPQWALAKSLLNLTNAVACQAAAEGLSAQSDQQHRAVLYNSCTSLVHALEAAAAGMRYDAVNAAAGCTAAATATALFAAVGWVWDVVCSLGQLPGALDQQQLLTLLQALVWLCIGGREATAQLVAAVLRSPRDVLAQSVAKCSSSSSSSGDSCGEPLLNEQCVLQAAAADALLQQTGLQDCTAEQLLLLGKMLTSTSAGALLLEHSTAADGRGAASRRRSSRASQEQVLLLLDPGGSSSCCGGSAVQLALLLLALHKGSRQQRACNDGKHPTAAAAAAAAAGGSVPQLPASPARIVSDDDEEELQFFHEIFCETQDTAAASTGNAVGHAQAAVAAAAGGGAAPVSVGQAWDQLAVVLCEGLLQHLEAAVESKKYVGGTSCHGQQQQQQQTLLAVLSTAVCFIGMDLQTNVGQQQPSIDQDSSSSSSITLQQLAALQHKMSTALLLLAGSSTCNGLAVVQHVLQQVVLGSVGPAAAGHRRSQQVMQLVARMVLQHAAVLVEISGNASQQQQQQQAGGIGSVQRLLLPAWQHLCAGLARMAQAAAEDPSTPIAAKDSCRSSSSSVVPLQEQSCWLLDPQRLALLLALVLSAPMTDRALLAAVTAQCLQQCLNALATAAATAANKPTAAAAAVAAGGDSTGTAQTDAACDSAAAVAVGPGALALSAVHACLSLLLWLLLSGPATPTAWVQLHLQYAVAAAAADEDAAAATEPADERGVEAGRAAAAAAPAAAGDISCVQQHAGRLQPLAVQQVTALLQNSSTDDLPMLLNALGIVAEQAQQLRLMQGLLPGLVPDCLPLETAAAAAPGGQAMQQLQWLIERMQEQESTASAMLQQALQQQQQGTVLAAAPSATATPSSRGWGQPAAPAIVSSSSIDAFQTLVLHAMDSVLRQSAAALAANSSSSSSSSVFNWPEALALVCCQQRGLQLLQLVSTAAAAAVDVQLCDAGAALVAAGFNSFGSYRHQLAVQQQLSSMQQLEQVAEASASSDTSSCLRCVSVQFVSQHSAGAAAVHRTATPPLKTAEPASAVGACHEAQQRRATATAVRLMSLLLCCLEDAVQKLQLCGDAAGGFVSGLLLQQLPGVCAELELMGLLIQAHVSLLQQHLPQLLPLLAKLQQQLAALHMTALTQGLSSLVGSSNSSSSAGAAAFAPDSNSDGFGSTSPAAAVQLMVPLAVDAEYAADELDLLGGGLGYCVVACLSGPHCYAWPSSRQPAAAAACDTEHAGVAATAGDAAAAATTSQLLGNTTTTVCSSSGGSSSSGSWGAVLQQLQLAHACLPPAPLPSLWWTCSFSRALDSLMGAGAALVAAAAAAAAADHDCNQAAVEQQQQQQGAQDLLGQQQATNTPAVAAAQEAVVQYLQDQLLLELRWPLLVKPLKQHYTTQLDAAGAFCLSSSSSSSSSSSKQAGSVDGQVLVQALQALVVEAAAALSTASAAAATGGAGHGSRHGACCSASAARAVAAAALGRVLAAGDTLASSSIAAASCGSSTGQQLLVSAIIMHQEQQQQQQQQQQQDGVTGGLLQQIWKGVGDKTLDMWRVADLIQELSGACQGAADPVVQGLHDQLLQQLRLSLLGLSEQQFSELLLRQLLLQQGFATSNAGFCRELWQRLLAQPVEVRAADTALVQDPKEMGIATTFADSSSNSSAASTAAVALLQRLILTCLGLCLSPAKLVLQSKQDSVADKVAGSRNSSHATAAAAALINGSSTFLKSVADLMGVVVTCACDLGQEGLLVCLQAIQHVASSAAAVQAAVQAAAASPGSDSSSVEETLDHGLLLQRLAAFLPLLLFAQEVLAAASSSSSSADDEAKDLKTCTTLECSGASEPRPQQRQRDSTAAPQAAVDATAAAAAAANRNSGDGAVSSDEVEPVVRDDYVQLLCATGNADGEDEYEDDEKFLDEYEDDDGDYEFPSGEVHNGAAEEVPGDDPPAEQATYGAGDTVLGEYDDEDEYEDYHDAEEFRQELLAGDAAGAQDLQAEAAAAAELAAAVQAAAAVAAAAAANAEAAALQDDEEDQALLDSEFLALLQQLLTAGAPADVALAAVTAATGLAPPAAAVAAAAEAAAASGDIRIIAAVEQLASDAAAGVGAVAAAHGAAAAAAAAVPPPPPPQAQQQQQQQTGTGGSAAGQPSAAAGTTTAARQSSSIRRRGSSSSSTGSDAMLLAPLRRYTQQQQQRRPAGVGRLSLGALGGTAHGSDADSAAAAAAAAGGGKLQCTFAVHGENFIEQHWYQCYTCGLVDSKGCCSACVHVCHAGHDVVYSAKSRFFCDCGGEGGARDVAVPCACLSPVLPAAYSAAAAGGGGDSASSSSSWLGLQSTAAAAACDVGGVPQCNAADPLSSAWAYDPQLFPGLCTGTGTAWDTQPSHSSSSSSSSSPGERVADGAASSAPAAASQSYSAGAAQRLLLCGSLGWAHEQAAAARQVLPQGLVSKAARALKPWLAGLQCATGPSASAGEKWQLLLGMVAGTMQLSRLLLGCLHQGAASATLSSSSSSRQDTAAAAAAVSDSLELHPVLPPMLQSKELVLEAVAASRSANKGSSNNGNSSSNSSSEAKTAANTAVEGSSSKQQSLLELQRVVRLGTMDSSGRASSSSNTGSSGFAAAAAASAAAAAAANRAPPPEVTDALEGGLIARRAADAAVVSNMLAVCRGDWVGIMDGWQLAAELCGKDVFTQEELAAASQSSSRSMNPSSSSSSNTTGGASSSSSFFYVRRHTAKFHVVSLSWDKLQGWRLLVTGYQQVQVWSINVTDYTVSDRLPLQLPESAETGQAGQVVLDASWLPGSDTWVAVTTPFGVYLYDVTHSGMQPAVTIEPQGMQLLAGGATFIQVLQQQQQTAAGGVCVGQVLDELLCCVLLTRDGQLQSAQLSQQLLAVQQSCASHWPDNNCWHNPAAAAAALSSCRTAGAGGLAAVLQAQNPASRTTSPGPALLNPAVQQQSPSGGGRVDQGGFSSGLGLRGLAITAEHVAWPEGLAKLQTGRSCHYCTGHQLLVVSGSSSNDGSSSSRDVQLLLQLNPSCSAVVHGCVWDSSKAVAPIFGSPKPLVLSPAALFWDVPLLPAARACYNTPQLLAVAPGQAKHLQSGGTSSTAAKGLGCAYITAISPPAMTAAAAAVATVSSSSSSSITSSWQVTTQPLHLRHSQADAYLDGLAVVQFPYTQQLLLVALCSMGNMYMYVSRRPGGLEPLQPHTYLLHRRLQRLQTGDKPAAAAAAARDGPPAAAGSRGSQEAADRAATTGCACDAAREQRALSRWTAAAAAPELVHGVGHTSSKEAAAAAAKPYGNADISIIEVSQHMNNYLSLAGDISRAGTREAAARVLLRTPADLERRLEAPTVNAGMKLIVKFAVSCGLVPVAIRLLLPAGGCAPASVTISAAAAAGSSSRGGGGSSSNAHGSGARASSSSTPAVMAGFSRVVQLAQHSNNSDSQPTGASSSSNGYNQRWYQIVLSPTESLAVLAAAAAAAAAATSGSSSGTSAAAAAASGGGELVLQFSAPLESTRRCGILHMDVWGQTPAAIRDRAAAEQQQATQQEELPLELTALGIAATSLGAPALPTAAAAGPAGLSHLLLHSLLSVSSAAAAAAVAHVSTADNDLQGLVQPVVQELLCPTAAAAACWYPSWALEAAAHQLLAAVTRSSSSSSSDALAVPAIIQLKDSWKLQQAAETLRQLAQRQATAAGCAVLTDSALLAFLHALGQLTNVLQARPRQMLRFMQNGACSSQAAAADAVSASASARLAAGASSYATSAAAAVPVDAGGSLAVAACFLLPVAVFSLKQLASCPLLPPRLLMPLTKTVVALLLADAQAKLQAQATQQQQQEAVAVAVQGLVALLLSPDAQLRIHAAAALVQASSSRSSSSSSGIDDVSAAPSAATSSACSTAAWRGVFKGVATAVLLQQGFTTEYLLPSYQAIAQIAVASSSSSSSERQQDSLAHEVAAMIVQQASSWQQQQACLSRSSGGSSVLHLQPITAEWLLLQQLLLCHILVHCQQQQQQQQQDPAPAAAAAAAAATCSAAGSSEHPTAHSAMGSNAAVLQIVSHEQVQQLQAFLQQLFKLLVPLLQQQEGIDSNTGSSIGTSHKLTGNAASQPHLGGWPGYQALLSPSPLLFKWGLTPQECASLFEPRSAGHTSDEVSAAAVSRGFAWLLDPGLEGRDGCRLTQGLPLQLAAAAVHTTHVLIGHGLRQAVGQLASVLPTGTAAGSTAGSTSDSFHQAAQQQQQQAWVGVLFAVMDLKCLKPLKHLAQAVLLDCSAGSPSMYKQHRAMHHLRRHAAALLQLLGLAAGTVSGSSSSSSIGHDGAAAAAAAVQLQMSWQQQCCAASLLSQLLIVAEMQPACWALVCSSSEYDPLLLQLLFNIALHCKAPQLCITAVKLFNLALMGSVVKQKSSSSSSSCGVSGGLGDVSGVPSKSKSSKHSSSGSSSRNKVQEKGTSQSSTGGSSNDSSSGPVITLDVSWLSTAAAATTPQQQQQPPMYTLIVNCVLGWPEPKERREAAKTLVIVHKALEAVNPEAQLSLLQLVLDLLPGAGSAAGAASMQLFAAAGHMIHNTAAAATATATATAAGSSSSTTASWQAVVASTATQLLATAVSAANALNRHPYAVAYQQLQQLLELEPPGSSSSSSAASSYWLELSSADVLGAGRPAKCVPGSITSLANAAAELRFGDRQVLARLNGYQHVYRLMLLLHNPRKSKCVAALRIWYCDEPISELQQLKSSSTGTSAPPAEQQQAASMRAAGGGSSSGSGAAWKLAADNVGLTPGQTELSVEFDLPLLASALMLELTGWHSSVNEAAGEVLHCPRCSHIVTDKHGLCGYCRENAYQCRQCRHINYEAPDAFICAECGHSRYGRFEVSLSAAAAADYPPLRSEAHWQPALKALGSAADAAARAAAALHNTAAGLVNHAAALAASAYSVSALQKGGSSSSSRSRNGPAAGGDAAAAAVEGVRPGLTQLAHLYVTRCKPAYNEALRTAKLHAGIKAAVAEAEQAAGENVTVVAAATAGSSSSSLSGAFSSSSYSHTEAVLGAVLHLLNSMLSTAPAAVACALRDSNATQQLLQLLQPSKGLASSVAATSHKSGSSSNNSASAMSSGEVTPATGIRQVLLALAKADEQSHHQLLMALHHKLLPQQQQQQQQQQQWFDGMPSLTQAGHEVQLLLSMAHNDVQQLEKRAQKQQQQQQVALPAGLAAAPQQLLQLLQASVHSTWDHPIWPELVIMPGLKVLTAAAAVQQQLNTQAAEAAAKAAAASAAAAAAAAAKAATAVEAPAPAGAIVDIDTETAAAVALDLPEVDIHDVAIITEDADAVAEAQERRKIAEYLARRGASTSQQQQQQQQRQQQYGSLHHTLTPYGYAAQQQQQQQQAVSGRGVARAASAGHTARKQPAAAAAAWAQKKPAEQQQQQQQQKPQAQDKLAAAPSAAAAVPSYELVSLPQLQQLCQQLLLHPHSALVRQGAGVLLSKLQPEAATRMLLLQQLLPAVCAAAVGTGPAAAAVGPGAEVVSLLKGAVTSLVVDSSSSSSSSKKKKQRSKKTDKKAAASATASTAAAESASAGHSNTTEAPAAAAAAVAAAVPPAAACAALNTLLGVTMQQLALLVAAVLQQQDQQQGMALGLRPSSSNSVVGNGNVNIAVISQLVSLTEQLLIGLAQLQQQQQQRSTAQGAHSSAEGGEWVSHRCLCDLLLATAGLDALLSARTPASKAALESLHVLIKQGWLEGGSSSSSSSKGMWSALPVLSSSQLEARRTQLTAALVDVLASELSQQQQQQQQQAGEFIAAAAAAAGGAPSAAPRRCSMPVCAALISLLAAAVTPEKPQPNYQLLLDKSPSQEEFIPGQLPSGGLVTAAAVAAAAGVGPGAPAGSRPLMRDVKNYICTRLDMAGLIDDDFGMELLVKGSIISLSLPVNDVVERHWWPAYQQQQQQQQRSSSSSGPTAAAAALSAGPAPGIPMPVIFRLSGLDGEATEPLVKDLNPAPGGAQNPEQEYALAAVLALRAGRGLGVLLQLLLLAQQQPAQALLGVRGQVLQLLRAAVRLEPCRAQLLGLGALGTLLHLVHLACKPLLDAAQHRSAGSSRGPVAATAAAGGDLGGGMSGVQLLLLLEVLEALVSAANTRGRPVRLDTTAANTRGRPVRLDTTAPAAAAGGGDDSASATTSLQQQQGRNAAAAAAASSLLPCTSSGSSGIVSSPTAAAAAAASSSAMEVAQLADGLSVLELAGLGDCAAVLARLLTALAQHSSTAQLGLLQHFAPALDLHALDAASEGSHAHAAVRSGQAPAADQAAAVDAASSDEFSERSEDGTDSVGASAADAGADDDDVVVLSAVHAAADGALPPQEHRLQLQGFLRLTEALSSSSSSQVVAAADAADVTAAAEQSGSSFKQLVLQQGIPTTLASYLVDVFMQPEQSAQDTTTTAAAAAGSLAQPGTAAWSAAAAKPGVPIALKLLTALAAGHAPTAAALAADVPQLLQLLHWLEGTAGGSTLTPLAEACLEAVAAAGDADVAAAVDALRAATAAEMKAKAAKKREALLASLGMVQVEAASGGGGGFKILPSPGVVPALSPLAAELAALESANDDDESSGGTCMVCREGYSVQPAMLLGCYCYCRVAIAAEWPGCCPPWSMPYDLLFTSVSHFNLIHVTCHAAAKTADASLRQSKREWQGATLRNGNVLCNALLPLPTPAPGKADTAYAAAVAAFWHQQLAAPSASEAAAAAGSSGGGGSGRSSSTGDAAAAAVTVSLSRRSAAFREADSSLLRVSLVTADIATLLRRFAFQQSFSEEARGGGRASNARLLLALLQLGLYYVVEAAADELGEAQQLLVAAGKAAAVLGLEAAAPAAAAAAAGVGATAATSTVSSSSTGSSDPSGGVAVPGCSQADMTELCACAPFLLALSLLLSSPAEWMAARRSLLAVAMRHAVARWADTAAAAEAGGAADSASSRRRSSSRCSSSGGSGASDLADTVSVLSDEQLYAVAAPMVRLFGVVDWLQQWAKPVLGAASSSSSSSSSGWSSAMASRLRDLAACSEAAGELLEVVDDAEGCLGLQDLVDSLGLLGVVLGAAGVDSCEGFVRRACAEV